MIEELFETLIRAGREPQISHDPGKASTGEDYCVSIKWGTTRHILRAHSIVAALDKACRQGVAGYTGEVES